MAFSFLQLWTLSIHVAIFLVCSIQSVYLLHVTYFSIILHRVLGSKVFPENDYI